MQISLHVQCVWRTWLVYRQHKSPLVMSGDELAFHRRGLCVSGSAHVTNGGSGGMMSTARLELPYPRGFPEAKFRDETSQRGK